MLGLRPLLVAALFGVLRTLAQAHAPVESTVSVAVSAEGYELVADLTLQSASVLLKPPASEEFSANTFPVHRKALIAAAGRVCTLLDVDDKPLTPDRTLVSLSHDGEVRFTFLYPDSARPASLRFDLLDSLPLGRFCSLTDTTVTPTRKAILLKNRTTYPLGSATAR